MLFIVLLLLLLIGFMLCPLYLAWIFVSMEVCMLIKAIFWSFQVSTTKILYINWIIFFGLTFSCCDTALFSGSSAGGPTVNAFQNLI
jgi:hypothetical protein